MVELILDPVIKISVALISYICCEIKLSGLSFKIHYKTSVLNLQTNNMYVFLLVSTISNHSTNQKKITRNKLNEKHVVTFNSLVIIQL